MQNIIQISKFDSVVHLQLLIDDFPQWINPSSLLQLISHFQLGWNLLYLLALKFNLKIRNIQLFKIAIILSIIVCMNMSPFETLQAKHLLVVQSQTRYLHYNHQQRIYYYWKSSLTQLQSSSFSSYLAAYKRQLCRFPWHRICPLINARIGII